MPKKEKQTMRDWFTKKEWDELVKQDPLINMMAATPWQDPDNFSTQATTISEIENFFPGNTDDEAKPSDLNWRELQKRSWQKYKTFGPLNASVNSKADYVAQAGFSVYSDVYEIDLFLKELFNSFRNKLYARVPGWMIRMFGEGEIFILTVFDEEGNATIRNLEPSKIGTSASDFGMLVDPDDASQTIFYEYSGAKKKELIPDVRFILEPEFMLERQKALGDKFKPEKIDPLTKGKGGKFKSIGGYRRFILHWKNLTGIYEYKRDTTSLATVIEWINLYVKALKWGMDHKRAISSYTWAVTWEDSPAGKVSWHIWNKMTDEQKAATGLTKALTPGSRVYLMPGMKLEVYSPQIQSMSGSNQDLLNMAGSGARTPQDLFQGQTAGSTYASVKSTRPPLEAEIENLQDKLQNFLRYEFLRVCFKAKIMMGGKFLAPYDNKTSIQLPEVYEHDQTESIIKNKPKIIKIKEELCEAVKFTWPLVQLVDSPDSAATAFLGSKNSGLYSIGVSADTIARKFGIDDLSRERKKRAIEELEFEVVNAVDAMVNNPSAQADKPIDKTADKIKKTGGNK